VAKKEYMIEHEFISNAREAAVLPGGGSVDVVFRPGDNPNLFGEKIRADFVELQQRLGSEIFPWGPRPQIIKDCRGERLELLYRRQLTDLTRDLHLSPIFDRLAI
jgi:hypothetical protein